MAATHGKADGFWEMREGGPYSEEEGTAREMFKCIDCGVETYPETGWNGEPDRKKCHPDCRREHGDWSAGRVTKQYRKNFDRVFPNAPGAGL